MLQVLSLYKTELALACVCNLIYRCTVVEVGVHG